MMLQTGEHERTTAFFPPHAPYGTAYTPPLDPEAQAVRAAQGGDLGAFNRLVLAHQDALYGWVLSLVKDESLAEDVTQSALITAYRKIADFRGGSFRAWLFAIARNRSIDLLRYHRRHPCVSLDEPAEGDGEACLGATLPAADPLPEEAAAQREQARLLLRLLEALPDPYRHVLRLVDWEGLDYHEAAEVLGLPIGTIKSRLSRARVRYRALLVANGVTA